MTCNASSGPVDNSNYFERLIMLLRWFAFVMVLIPATAIISLAADFPVDKLDDSGFETVFDGKSLKGWHVSTQTGHSGASMHTSGGKWVLEEGAVVGSQDIPGNGGIILTDRQFDNFEVIVEMKNDYGPDSGLFLRWVAQVAASATCVPTAQEVAGNVALDSSASSGFATPVGSKPPTGATLRSSRRDTNCIRPTPAPPTAARRSSASHRRAECVVGIRRE